MRLIRVIMFSVIANIYNKKTKGPTYHTVVSDIDSSLAAVPFDFFGLCRKLARTHSTSSSAVNGQPLDFCLHRHPDSVNCLYHARMVLSVGGLHSCTLHSNHRLTRVIFQHTKLLLPRSGHFLTTYTRIA
jgi:hypothetical protein